MIKNSIASQEEKANALLANRVKQEKERFDRWLSVRHISQSEWDEYQTIVQEMH